MAQSGRKAHNNSVASACASEARTRIDNAAYYGSQGPLRGQALNILFLRKRKGTEGVIRNKESSGCNREVHRYETSETKTVQSH
jgi:hypothetical protein